MRLRRYLFDMKPNDLNKFIESSLFNEVKKRIINESKEGGYEVYEITHDGEPVQVCGSEKEANEIVDKLKKEHPGKQFIIEPGEYNSYDHMIDELDKMGEELQEKENQNMKKKTVKSLAEAILDAKMKNKSRIVVNEEVINVDEKWKEMEEEETQCEGCSMEEDLDLTKYPEEEGEEKPEDVDFPDQLYSPEEEGEEKPEDGFGPDYDNLPDGSDKSLKEVDIALDDFEDGNTLDFEDGNTLDIYKDKYKDKTHSKMGEESLFSKIRNFSKKVGDKWNDSLSDYKPDDHEKFISGMAEGGNEPGICSECGTGELNEEGQCNECGSMKESTKKKLRLKESELVSLISKMVTEAKKKTTTNVPGLTVTKKAQDRSKIDNSQYAKELEDKLKKYLSFDGNDNPEFPKPIGKGSKMAHRNTSDNEKKIEDNRGETNSDLSFDYEPSEGFKKRVKASLEGDSKMGNSSDAGNVVKDKVGKQIVDKKKRKIDDKKKKKDVSWGHSWIMPADVDIVAESNNKKTDLLKEEINKINKLSFYNKKTQ